MSKNSKVKVPGGTSQVGGAEKGEFFFHIRKRDSLAGLGPGLAEDPRLFSLPSPLTVINTESGAAEQSEVAN